MRSDRAKTMFEISFLRVMDRMRVAGRGIPAREVTMPLFFQYILPQWTEMR